MPFKPQIVNKFVKREAFSHLFKELKSKMNKVDRNKDRNKRRSLQPMQTLKKDSSSEEFSNSLKSNHSK